MRASCRPLLCRLAALPFAIVVGAGSLGLPTGEARADGATKAAETGLSQPVKLGEATLRFLGLQIYSATLHTQGTEQFDWGRPLSLRLDYARGFTAQELLAGTEKEITRIEGTRPDQAEIFAKLATCFEDVEKGDAYVALAPTPDRVTLRLNGRQTCDISHAGLRKRFLGIWLSPNSRSARLSSQLRGETGTDSGGE